MGMYFNKQENLIIYVAFLKSWLKNESLIGTPGATLMAS
jgi:hypothetical protein